MQRILMVLVVCSGLFGCGSEPLLDKQAVLERQNWWDNRDWDWYKEKIPFFESPDPDIDATYYYRWEVLTKHLTYGSPETGYTFTEFIDRPFWSGTYGAISCPAGHQFYEVRWLKDRRIIDDFAKYWFETPGAQPRSYSNWYGDAMWATYMVLGDETFIQDVLPHMEAQYAGWVDERWDPDHQMFRWDGMHDGMETNINSRQTADSFMGAEGYRPTLNSYLFADALAISRAARLMGDSIKANLFERRALELRERVQTELWDPQRSFFLHQFANDELRGVRAKSLTYETGPYAGSPHGRELIGYVPWQFNLPEPGYEEAWRFLMDEEYFAAPYGPTTVEQNDPLFMITTVCCVWSGNAWPYATTQTLVAMANLLNNYAQSYVDTDDYFAMLKTYTMDQRKGDRPYIAEAADPYTGSWEGHDTFYHSEHYLHSGYVDLIISGLVGLRPRADDTLEVKPLVPSDWDYFALADVSYRGRSVSIVWDRDGTRYGRDPGLTLLVDGTSVANSPMVTRLAVQIDPNPPVHTARPINFAVNNDGTYFPAISASYSEPESPPHYANDGHYWYHRSPPNRWTTVGSGSLSAWLAVDFGVERPIDTVKLHFLDDSSDVQPPAAFRVQYDLDGEWHDLPQQHRTPVEPTGRRANVIAFDRLETTGVRVVFTHRDGTATGVSEFEVWGDGDLPLPPPTAPVVNLAFNVHGGRPAATASYETSTGPASHVNDQRIAFTRYSRNRWSTVGSPSERDWIQLDFGGPVSVATVDLYVFSDEDRGVAAPRRYAVQYRSDALWVEANVILQEPEAPRGSALNRTVIEPVETDALRIVLEHQPEMRSAVSEIKAWSDPPQA
jgi:hypothetical protein